MLIRPPRWPRSTLSVLPDLHHDPPMHVEQSSTLREPAGEDDFSDDDDDKEPIL